MFVTARSLTACVCSSVAVAGSLKQWTELCAALPTMLDSGNVDAVDGALDALFKVCMH